MNLPENKDPIRIEYAYDDGKVFYVDKKDADIYISNVKSASVMGWVHGQRFNPINWKKKK